MNKCANSASVYLRGPYDVFLFHHITYSAKNLSKNAQVRQTYNFFFSSFFWVVPISLNRNSDISDRDQLMSK